MPTTRYRQSQGIKGAVDFAPGSSGTNGNLRRAFGDFYRIQASQVDRDPTRHVGASGRACVTTAANSKFERTDAVAPVDLMKVRQDKGQRPQYSGV